MVFMKKRPSSPQFFLKLVAFGIVTTIIILCTIRTGYIRPVNISIRNFINKTDIAFIDESKPRYPNYSKQHLDLIETRKKCFELKEPAENLDLLVDIDENPPKPDKNIFFTITTCFNVSRVKLIPR